ncbi:MAG: small multi-drug export protein [FCB group bacterium]|nr:small multi-drug export protein [FCB group bacterium]
MLEELIHSTQPAINFLALVVIQLILGKKVSFPYGIVFGFDPVNLGIIITICDIFFITFLLFVFESSSKIKIISRFRGKYTAKSDKWKDKRSFQYFNKLGKIGVVTVIIIPFTGGLWMAYILANLLFLKKTETFSLTMLGAILGNSLFVLSSMGILKWVI